MLTPAIIFDYVWQHFCSLYPEAKNLPVNYGGNKAAKVQVSNTGFAFFEKQIPFPENISWQNWSGTNIPLLFPSSQTQILSETASGEVKINADLIAGAFYFLSGWQEFYAEVRDHFGRFPYRESLQAKHNFVTIPVVNYYFCILKTALEKGYGLKLKKSGWGNSEFVTFLSHDIDRLESAWKVAGLSQFKKGNFSNFLKLLWQKASGKDHWNNLETVAQTVKKSGAVSTFFWLPQNGKFRNYPNADYNITEPALQKLIFKLEAEGFEQGLHGSFGTSEDLAQLQTELKKIPAKVTGNRFHYLKFDPKKTPEILAESNLAYDSTLGFAEHFGFRHGYCFPFRPFDFSRLKPYPFLELPLHLMDATLWHPNYLQLKPEEILPAISPMLQEIKKFGGCFGWLWHNENFSKMNTKNGLAAFQVIMKELRNLQSGFLTGSEIATNFQERFK